MPIPTRASTRQSRPTLHCACCGRPFNRASGRGPAPLYCSADCRVQMRIRQRPGPRNALGKVKLTMPNPMNIYLRDTPSRALFAQARRDFSHGCIRVDRVVELAAFALGRDPKWGPEAIADALRESELRVARVAPPV